MGIRFLIRIGRGVWHTPKHVSGGSIICPWSWEFVGRMQHAPTLAIQSLQRIRFNKYVFVRYLSRIGRGVLHTPQNVPGGSIICPWSWAFVGRMQYAPTQTVQSFPGIGFNKYVFIMYLSRMGRGVLHTPQHVPGLMGIMIHTIHSFSGIGFNKYVFKTYLSWMGATESICYRSLPRFWFISLNASGYTYRLWA